MLNIKTIYTHIIIYCILYIFSCSYGGRGPAPQYSMPPGDYYLLETVTHANQIVGHSAEKFQDEPV